MAVSIASMTGFARAEGAHERWRWSWELRTVNSRGLEWRVRLPAGYEALDPELRKAAKGKITRGSFNATLNLGVDKDVAQYRINEAMLADAIKMIERVSAEIECAPPRAEGVLAIRGVIEPVEDAEDEGEQNALRAALLASFKTAVDQLVEARRKEGEALAKVLASQFSDIADLTEKAVKHAAAAPAALKARIEMQLKELLADGGVPEDRLAQEAALLAVKADIREEIDRLQAHAASAQAMLKKSGPVGRELDFLTQEFNREANTLCSKASDMELKTIGLELKRVIDQIREQVQNVE